MTEMQSGSVLHLSACLALDGNSGQTVAAAAAAAAADAAATAAEAAVVAAVAAQQAATAATHASARTSMGATNQGNGRGLARPRAVRPDDSWRVAPQKRRSKSPGYHQPSGRSRRLTSKQRQQWTPKGSLPEGGGHSTKAKDGQPRKAPPRHYWSPVPKGTPERGAGAHRQSSRWKKVEHQSTASGTSTHQSSQSTQSTPDTAERTSTIRADDQTNPASTSSRAEPQRFSLTGRDSDDDEADFFPKESVEIREPADQEASDTLTASKGSDVTAAMLHVPQEASQDAGLSHQNPPNDTTGLASGSHAEEGRNESRQSASVEKPHIELHAEVQAVRQTEQKEEVQVEPHAQPQPEPQGELHKREEVGPQHALGAGEHR